MLIGINWGGLAISQYYIEGYQVTGAQNKINHISGWMEWDGLMGGVKYRAPLRW